MKMIMISTDLEMTVHDFPSGDYSTQNKAITELIGNGCTLYEHVNPVRLYQTLNHMPSPTKIPGQCVCMLIDEEGAIKGNQMINIVGSYLYGTDKHGYPIMGNIIICGEVWTDDGVDFCGIDDSVFTILEGQLKTIISKVKSKEAV